MDGSDFRRRLSQLLDLPADVTLDLPKILIVGPLQMAVENHRGLIEYSPERLVVAVSRGQMVIKGRGLIIGTITSEEITVLGEIQSLSFES